MKFGWFVEKMVGVYFRKERPYLENHSPPHTMHTLNSHTQTRPHSHSARMWKWTSRIVVVHLHQATTCPHTRDDIDLQRNIKANLFSFEVPSGRARPCVSVCFAESKERRRVHTHGPDRSDIVQYTMYTQLNSHAHISSALLSHIRMDRIHTRRRRTWTLNASRTAISYFPLHGRLSIHILHIKATDPSFVWATEN